MKVAETSKNLGASPLQSQVIQNLDTQKRCFLGTFFENIAILTHFDKTNPPPHDIYRWKAMDLRLDLAASYRGSKHPTSRQNFDDAVK